MLLISRALSARVLEPRALKFHAAARGSTRLTSSRRFAVAVQKRCRLMAARRNVTPDISFYERTSGTAQRCRRTIVCVRNGANVEMENELRPFFPSVSLSLAV